jgi:hypothetical protein
MDGSSMPRPQPSAKGQQGAPEITVSDGEMVQFYRQILANCQHQSGISAMLVEKLRAAVADRDVRIAELEAEVSALRERVTELETTAANAVNHSAQAGELDRALADHDKRRR